MEPALVRDEGQGRLLRRGGLGGRGEVVLVEKQGTVQPERKLVQRPRRVNSRPRRSLSSRHHWWFGVTGTWAGDSD